MMYGGVNRPDDKKKCFLYGQVKFFGRITFLFKEVRICYLFGQNRIYLEGFVQTNLTGFFVWTQILFYSDVLHICSEKLSICSNAVTFIKRNKDFFSGEISFLF